MAHVNQGYYRQLRKEFKKITEDSIRIENEVFDSDGNFEGDRELAWETMDDYNYLYKNCNELNAKIGVLLNSQSFEQKKLEEEYNGMYETTKEIISNAIYNYKNVKGLMGNDFSDAERESISDFEIEKEI